MVNKESVIGQNIICGGVGIGEIVDVTPLHEGGEEFYKVSFPKEKCTNYLSINNNNNYRILSTKKVLNKAIKEFNTKFDKLEYATTQEKINTQKELLKETDIVKLARSLTILNREAELHAQIKKPFKDALSTFVEEIEFVLGIKNADAYSMLNMKAPKKAK